MSVSWKIIEPGKIQMEGRPITITHNQIPEQGPIYTGWHDNKKINSGSHLEYVKSGVYDYIKDMRSMGYEI
jgi:hypothetical protein